MINSTEKSRILLLNLGLDTDKVAIKTVGVKELRDIFGGFGQLTKVIVFTRKLLLKAFLEYADFESAEKAKSAFHEKTVKNYGKARLYFSPLQNIKFSNKYLEFWEEGAKDNGLAQEEDTSTKNSLKFIGSENFKQQNNQRNELRATSSKFSVNEGYQLFSVNQQKQSSYAPKNSFMSGSNIPFGKIIHDPLLNPSDIISKPYPQYVDANLSVLSRVVLVSNLANVFKNCNEVFNLFSAFGNIITILFMKNHQKALIEYTDLQYANEAITNLNHLELGETCLHLSYSKYHTIDLEKNNKNENSMQFNEVFVVPPIMNRYTPKPQTSVSSLSSSLILSFSKSEKSQTLDIYLAIEKLCKPSKTKLVNGKGKLGAQEMVHMLFSFEDVPSAVYVLYKCHRTVVKGALLDVSFF